MPTSTQNNVAPTFSSGRNLAIDDVGPKSHPTVPRLTVKQPALMNDPVEPPKFTAFSHNFSGSLPFSDICANHHERIAVDDSPDLHMHSHAGHISRLQTTAIGNRIDNNPIENNVLQNVYPHCQKSSTSSFENQLLEDQTQQMLTVKNVAGQQMKFSEDFILGFHHTHIPDEYQEMPENPQVSY